jgi:hypothetical protein
MAQPVTKCPVYVWLPDAEPFLLYIHPRYTGLDFVDDVKIRLAGQNIRLDVASLQFHAGGADGPIINNEDTLWDLVVIPRVPNITATYPPRGVAQGSIKLRVITPALARTHTDRHSIPTLPTSITTRNTLGEVRTIILNSLEPSISNAVPVSTECNCSFATLIGERAILGGGQSEAAAHQDGPPFKLVLVRDWNKVSIIETLSSDKLSLRRKVMQEIGEEAASKEINLIGGTRNAE